MKTLFISIAILIGIAATAVYYPIQVDATLTGDGTYESPLGVASSFSTAKVAVTDTATMLAHFVERADTASMLTNYILRSGRSGGQTVVGGSGTTDDLILQSTRGVGTTGALIQMKVGNNGATVAQTILNNGLIGIGTTTPTNLSGAFFGGTQVNPLWVSGTGAITALVIQGQAAQGAAIQYVNESSVATADFGVYSTDLYFVNRQNAGDIIFNYYTSGGAQATAMKVGGAGKLGVQTSSEDKALEVNLGTADAFRLSYNDANGSAANYCDFTISSVGSPTFNATGTSPTFTFSDPVLFDGYARLKAYTVATLPTGVTGAMAYCTDLLTPTYLATAVGGGAVVAPVFYNGSNWICH